MKSVNIFLPFLVPLPAAVLFLHTCEGQLPVVNLVCARPTAPLTANETSKEKGIEIYISKTDQATKYVRLVLFNSLPTKTSLVTGRNALAYIKTKTIKPITIYLGVI